MFEATRDFCNHYFGWIDWDAVSGLGAALALIWAVILTVQQNADQRRREAALIKAIMVTVDMAGQSITTLYHRLRWSLGYETDNLSPDELIQRRADVTKQLNTEFIADTVETAILRLEAIKVTDIPSSRVITSVLSLLVRMRNIHEQAVLMTSDKHDASELVSQSDAFLTISWEMAHHARAIGVRAEKDDTEWLIKGLGFRWRAIDIALVAASPVMVLIRQIRRPPTSGA